MSVIAKKPEGPGILTPEGTCQAVCYGVWDIGIQKISWNGMDKPVHKVVIGWEINEKIDMPESEYHGKPYVISNRYTLSLSEKSNLYKHLTSWRGKPFTKEELDGFDLEKLIGANCMLNVVHNEVGERVYANISGIMRLPKGMPSIIPETPHDPPQWVKFLQNNQYDVSKSPKNDDFLPSDFPPPDEVERYPERDPNDPNY